MTSVPVVDIDAPQVTAKDLDAACVEHGFFLLRGHGLDRVIERTWTATRSFFDAERSVRTAIMRSEDAPLGFFDRELTKRRRDHKEVFDFIDPRTAQLDALNQWPVALPEFRTTMIEFFTAFSDLSMRTLGLLHEVLGLDRTERPLVASDPSASTVRLNQYTVGDPVPEEERSGLPELGETALGHHTDPGVLTLLLQDDIGGLQTRALDGSWLDVPPIPGTVVVNLGDCMQVWTNDRYRAAIHRVLPVPDRRFSIPYFSNPPRTATIAPMSSLSMGAPHYRPFTWREFSAARAQDNFADLGVADTQISDYRLP
jgi:isopenicillin N synthase-like dioxygenase